MFGLLDQHPDVSDKPGATALVVGDGAERFEAVNFGYTPRRQILIDCDFEIPDGHKVAVVGHSGSG